VLTSVLASLVQKVRRWGLGKSTKKLVEEDKEIVEWNRVIVAENKEAQHETIGASVRENKGSQCLNKLAGFYAFYIRCRHNLLLHHHYHQNSKHPLLKSQADMSDHTKMLPVGQLTSKQVAANASPVSSETTSERDDECDPPIASDKGEGDTKELKIDPLTTWRTLSPELVERLWPGVYTYCEESCHFTRRSSNPAPQPFWLPHPPWLQLTRLRELMSGEKCSVLVGPQEIKFIVPADSLRTESDFPERWLHWKEVKLPDISSETFAAIVDCLITGEIREHHHLLGNGKNWQYSPESEWATHRFLDDRINILPLVEILLLAGDELGLFEVNLAASLATAAAVEEDKSRWREWRYIRSRIGKASAESISPGFSTRFHEALVVKAAANAELGNFLYTQIAPMIVKNEDLAVFYQRCMVKHPEFAAELLDMMEKMISHVERFQLRFSEDTETSAEVFERQSAKHWGLMTLVHS
jgi:hypothetical protein